MKRYLIIITLAIVLMTVSCIKVIVVDDNVVETEEIEVIKEETNNIQVATEQVPKFLNLSITTG